MTKHSVWLVGFVLSTLVFAGCGDDSNDGQGVRTATPTETPTPTATPNERTASPTPAACAGFYAGKIAEPLLEPDGDIPVRSTSVVRFEDIGDQEDTPTASVNGELVDRNRTLDLKPGRNVVDFVVLGEGEVHYWHVVYTVDDAVVFEHQQDTLEPRYVCQGEMYRFHLVFVAS